MVIKNAPDAFEKVEHLLNETFNATEPDSSCL